MSFTLYKRNLNGETVPIKMSIWDAFHGAPNPKPRRKDPCACCGKFHVLTDKAREQFSKDECVRNGGTGVPADQIQGRPQRDSNNKNNQANKGGDGGNKTNTFSTSAEETYTDQEDAIIMRMKQESKSWAEILKAVGKTSKSQVQARYKQLEGRPGPGTTQDGESSVDNDKDLKKAKAEKDKAEGLNKQAGPSKAKEGEAKRAKEKGTKKKGQKSSVSKTEDSAVKVWADRYDRQKWVAMASKHFDKTGRRITPEQARKLGEGE